MILACIKYGFSKWHCLGFIWIKSLIEHLLLNSLIKLFKLFITFFFVNMFITCWMVHLSFANVGHYNWRLFFLWEYFMHLGPLIWNPKFAPIWNWNLSQLVPFVTFIKIWCYFTMPCMESRYAFISIQQFQISTLVNNVISPFQQNNPKHEVTFVYYLPFPFQELLIFWEREYYFQN